MTRTYDLNTIRNLIWLWRWRENRNHRMIVRGGETFMEYMASQLFLKLFDAHPGRFIETGDTWDLLADEMYAWGRCDLPDRQSPVREAFVRIEVDQSWGPLWIIFTHEGAAFCKTWTRKGVWLPKAEFGEVLYEDPRFCTIIERVLSHIGWPLPSVDFD